MIGLEPPGVAGAGKRSAELELGNDHLRRGRLELAAACFELALDKARDARAARLLAHSRVALGLGRIHAGDFPGARAEFQSALRADPTQVAACRLLAQSALRAGQPLEALARLDEAAARAPEGVATLLLRAVCLEAVGRATGAVAALDAALAAALEPRDRYRGRFEDPQRPAMSATRSPALGSLAEEPEAEAPPYADQRCRLGVQLLVRRPHAAGRHLEAALALNPRYLRARVALALLRLDQGRSGEAREELARAQSQAPDYPDVQAWRGLACLRSGRAREATVALEGAVATRREFARAHRHLALAYHALGRPRDALQAARRGWVRRRDAALPLAPIWPPGFEVEAAEESQLALALAVRPTSPDLWLALARCHNGQRNPGAARRALQQALALHGDYGPALMELARLELSEGDARAAESALAGLTRRRPGWADAQALLGRARLELGDLQGAMLPLRTALRLNPELEEARRDLVAALLRLPGRRPPRAAPPPECTRS